MTTTVTRYEVRRAAAWITLDAPESRNALSAPLVTELRAHLRTATDDPAVRAIVLTGTGPAFCAGADLKNRGDAVAPGSGAPNPFVEILRAMWDGPKPVIVAANGHAFGGGVGLVAAADIAIAVDTAMLSFSEVRLGVIPAMISVVVLPKLGVHQAMRLFLTGARFTAAEAQGYGLVHRVVPAADLAAAVQAEVDAIALGGPNAVLEAKKLIRTVSRVSMEEGFAYAEAKIAELFASPEAADGMLAFATKQKPSWARCGVLRGQENPRGASVGRAQSARPHGADIFDVCVIGTGAGGGVMIQELTAAGFRVVALQRGPALSPSDFVDDELKVMIRDALFSPNQVETFRPDDRTSTVTGRFNATADCVGGTMTHWSAWSWRFRPDDFRVRSTEGAVAGASLADWPFPYEEIEPFYEKAEWDFGVSGSAYANPFGAPRKKDYPNPPHPERVSSRRFRSGAEKLGYHPFPLPLAINSRAYGGRAACMYGGACYGFGCPVHAKATSLSVCIPKAQATGKLDLRANVVAREITVGKDGRARSVRYLDEAGKEHEVQAKQIVVSGNSIGSSHLLLMSTSGAFPQGLANSSGLVGKNLTFHTVPAVGFTIDEPALGYTGFNGHVAVDDLHPSDPKRGFIRGGVISEPNAGTATPMFYWALTGAGAPMERSFGAPLKAFLRKFPRAVLLAAVLEDLPMESNRVDLDPTVKDRFGLPVPRITHGQHPNDLAMFRWYQQRLMDLAEASGATEKWYSQVPGFTKLDEKTPMNGGHVGHFMGTCRMGTDPKSSVLDKWCRTHDVPNLWVVDGSCFPTSGGYNPTLTILANAYRVADHFVAEAKRRNL